MVLHVMYFGDIISGLQSHLIQQSYFNCFFLFFLDFFFFLVMQMLSEQPYPLQQSISALHG
jgi:hypothetical protein